MRQTNHHQVTSQELNIIWEKLVLDYVKENKTLFVGLLIMIFITLYLNW